MNRLTKVESSSVLIKDGWKKKDTESYTSICYGCEEIGKCVNKCGFYKALEKLTEYEDTGLEPHHIDDILGQLLGYLDAEQAGLLIELPCKVGDIVYKLEDYGEWQDVPHALIPIMCQVELIFIGDDNKVYCDLMSIDLLQDGAMFDEIPINEIFLTREEAEKALEDKANE